MDGDPSFGRWVKERRTALGLHRSELAQRVVCATVILRKIEADERRSLLSPPARLRFDVMVEANLSA